MVRGLFNCGGGFTMIGAETLSSISTWLSLRLLLPPSR
jgi:hypothetical protein